MSLHAPKSRWTAAPLHLLLSLLVIGGIAIAALLLWFPAGLHRVANLGHTFKVMLAIDIVVGPFLTLLLYRPGKRGLKVDLAMIALLQLGFLAYGLHVLWQKHPVFLVGSKEAFAVVLADEAPAGATEGAEAKGWSRFHGTGPWLVGVDLSDRKSRDAFLDAYLSNAAGPLQDARRYLPYARVARDIARAAATVQPPSLPVSSSVDSAVMLVDAKGWPLRVVP